MELIFVWVFSVNPFYNHSYKGEFREGECFRSVQKYSPSQHDILSW